MTSEHHCTRCSSRALVLGVCVACGHEPLTEREREELRRIRNERVGGRKPKFS